MPSLSCNTLAIVPLCLTIFYLFYDETILLLHEFE